VRHSTLNKHKPQYHVQFIQSIVERIGKANFPNLVYIFDEGARGNEPQCCMREKKKVLPQEHGQQRRSGPDRNLPFLAIAKSKGYGHPGLLVPNPYFADLDDWEAAQIFFQEERSNMDFWKRRDPRCLWRGTILAKNTCAADSGNYARFCAVVKSAQEPALLDAKAVGHFRPRDPADEDEEEEDCRRTMPYDAAMRKVIALNKVNKTAAYQADFMSPRDFMGYRFLLNLPGVQGGSYSRNLNHLWNTGAVVLLWNSPHVEW